MFRLPQQFHEAVRLFNEGEYFECHEVLEELWRAEPSSFRLLYQGVLQVAVGCYHLSVRHNRHGAVSKLRAGLQKLGQFPAVVDTVDLADLREQIATFLQEVEQMSDEQIAGYSGTCPLVIRYLV
ncbi:MAG: DUF309 domain-containing protein [Chthonomonadetes bacterium]|nr:DUF309 domain-containing protein [Chthonomonadetes bacterium]